MRIKVTDGVLIKGKPYRRGDEVELDAKVARELEQMGRAVIIKESDIKAEPKPAEEPAEARGLTTETFPVSGKQHRHKKGY